MKRMAATKLLSWCWYSSDDTGAKQPCRTVSRVWASESPLPSAAERWRVRRFSEDVSLAWCYFGNWNGEKPSPDSPVTSARRSFPRKRAEMTPGNTAWERLKSSRKSLK